MKSTWHARSPSGSLQSEQRLPLRRRALSESMTGELSDRRGGAAAFNDLFDDRSPGKGQKIKQVWRKLAQPHRDQRHSMSTTPTCKTDSSTSTSNTRRRCNSGLSILPGLPSSLPHDIESYMLPTPNSYDSRGSNNTTTTNSNMNDYFSCKQQQNSVTTTRKDRKNTSRKKKNRRSFHGKFDKDVVGVTFLEICFANDLPPEKNLARTSFDMDPFVVVSYGTSSFRTKVVRHNLNPTWNEKLFFHVRRTETTFHFKFTVYDREKFHGNGRVAWCQLAIQDVMEKHSKDIASTATNVNDGDDDNTIEKDMDMLTLPLQLEEAGKWKNKRPTLTIRAKFMPYQLIRKLFWISLAKTYDSEETGTLSQLQVQTMLDTIGSTISDSTLASFWQRYAKDPDKDEELTFDELVECLEDYIRFEDEEEEALQLKVDTPRHATAAAPAVPDDIPIDGNENVEAWDSTLRTSFDEDEDEDEDEAIDISDSMLTTDDGEDDTLPFGINPELFDYSLPLQNTPLERIEEVGDVVLEGDGSKVTLHQKNKNPQIPYSEKSRNRNVSEKIVRLKECPICHKPNLSRKSQMDILTHVATCAANDWTTVDRFLMQDYLTEAYAQRRWLGKLVRKVSYGRYSLGKDNANILVQDRATGHLIEEKIAAHVRLGMRLIYKRMRNGIQSKAAQRLLTNMTLRQGRRFDSPKSVKEIPAFIKFHNISLAEVAQPLSSFKTFNQFFYRKLKPGARSVDSPKNATVAVSPADCRVTVFETITDATKLWIKGVDFSLRKLLSDSKTAKELEGGSLGVFRLAPQDYHRFHSPVDGTITRVKHIDGQFYTVNPMAIRTSIDVFGENSRVVIWMESKEFGKVIIVCVGAMLVGSIILTAKVGSTLKRADELGYFAFGGSTLIVIFEKDKVIFDADLLFNSDRTNSCRRFE